jgi:3-deoxy-7-phosphoheptulonate synthase
MVLAGVMAGADGIIYESHEIPEKAYSDGQQTLDFAQSARLATWIRESFVLRKGFDLL